MPAVDDGEGVQALHEDALPLGGYRVEREQLVHGHALLPGQQVQARVGKVVAPGWRDELRCVGNRKGKPSGLQSLDGGVYGAPGPSETAAISSRSRNGIEARRRSSSPSHPAVLTPHAPGGRRGVSISVLLLRPWPDW